MQLLPALGIRLEERLNQIDSNFVRLDNILFIRNTFLSKFCLGNKVKIGGEYLYRRWGEPHVRVDIQKNKLKISIIWQGIEDRDIE